MNSLIYTGSSVSGNGYGYSIFRDTFAPNARFFVRIRLAEHTCTIPADDYVHAHEVGQSFNHACRQWQVVQARQAALESGIAVIG